MNIYTNTPTPEKTMFAGTWSLASITATVILASIDHAYEFGYRALVAGFILISVLFCFNILYQRTRNTFFLVLYGLLNVWVIIGFGLIKGFWNHTFKMILIYLHSGQLPSSLAKLFMTAKIGGSFVEGVGMLTFVASMFAAYYMYAFVKEGR